MVSSLNKKLIQAVITGDVVRLNCLLEDYGSLYSRTTTGTNNNPRHTNATSPLSMVRDKDGNTLLHLAVLRCRRQIHGNDKRCSSVESSAASNLKILEILLSHTDERIDPSVTNDEGQTPLHFFHALITPPMAVATELSSISVYSTSSQNKLKLTEAINPAEHKNYVDTYLSLAFPDAEESSAVIDIVDKNGCNALYWAVKQKCSHCIQRLLKYGASLNIKSQNYNLPFVTPQIFQDPWAVHIVDNRLNKMVTYQEFNKTEDISESEAEESTEEIQTRFEVSFDFSCIVPKSTVESEKPESEMGFIETFLSADSSVRKQVLGHPLVASFVFMKWERVRKIYIVSFAGHIALAILFTAYAMTVYLVNCPYRSNKRGFVNQSNANETLKLPCDTGLGSLPFSVILLVIAGILAVLELLKMAHNFHLYKRQWNNLFQFVMIMCMCLAAWPISWTSRKTLYNWQYSVAAYGIFHVWSTLMINMGRFPKLGIYVEMFGKVLQNFAYFMSAYVFLIIAFSIAFCVVFPDYPPFETIPRAVLKVITMMSGEVDLDFFYGEPKDAKSVEIRGDLFFKGMDTSDLIHPVTAHISCLAFVLFITIGLTNLLIGLAVDDIKALAQNAELTKTTREVANIAYVESLVFWNTLPNIDVIRRLRKYIVIGRLQNNGSDTNAGKIDRNMRRVVKFCRGFLSFKHSRNTRKRDSTKRFQLPKYSFHVSLDDCKPPRHFPEDTYLKAVDLIKRQKKAVPNTTTTNTKHCLTCKCPSFGPLN